jgi:hypothetical protein
MNGQILQSTVITQEDIHVYLSLIESVKSMKASIIERLEDGGEVEPGVHKASLSTFDRKQVDQKYLHNFIKVAHGQEVLDTLIEDATTVKEVTRLNIK